EVDGRAGGPKNRPSAKKRGSASIYSRHPRGDSMRGLLILVLVLAFIAVGVAGYYLVVPALGGGPVLAGTWKVTFFLPTGVEMSPWLVQIETKRDELDAKVLSAPYEELRKAKVARVARRDTSLHMKMTMEVGMQAVDVPIIVYFPENETNPNVLR